MPLQVSLLLVSQLRRAVRVAGPLDPRLVPPAQCEGWLEGQPTRSQVPQCPRAHEELSPASTDGLPLPLGKPRNSWEIAEQILRQVKLLQRLSFKKEVCIAESLRFLPEIASATESCLFQASL